MRGSISRRKQLNGPSFSPNTSPQFGYPSLESRSPATEDGNFELWKRSSTTAIELSHRKKNGHKKRTEDSRTNDQAENPSEVKGNAGASPMHQQLEHHENGIQRREFYRNSDAEIEALLKATSSQAPMNSSGSTSTPISHTNQKDEEFQEDSKLFQAALEDEKEENPKQKSKYNTNQDLAAFLAAPLSDEEEGQESNSYKMYEDLSSSSSPTTTTSSSNYKDPTEQNAFFELITTNETDQRENNNSQNHYTQQTHLLAALDSLDPEQLKNLIKDIANEPHKINDHLSQYLPTQQLNNNYAESHHFVHEPNIPTTTQPNNYAESNNFTTDPITKGPYASDRNIFVGGKNELITKSGELTYFTIESIPLITSNIIISKKKE
jgi:hypothetical protein